MQKPEKRRHDYQDGQDTVAREVTPHLDPISQTVTVHYDVSVKRGQQIIKRIQEDHTMRFMFIQEIAFAMEAAGLKLIHCCPFLEADGDLTTDTWNVAFVAQREP